MRHALIVLSVAAGMPPLWTRAADGTNGASFRGLGDLPGGAFGSVAQAVSADGSVVVGIANHRTGIDSRAFRWTSAEGMVSLGTLAGNVSSAAMGVSGNGAVVVGIGYGSSGAEIHAFRWSDAEGMAELARLPGSTGPVTEAFDASSDGSIVVGLDYGPSGREACWWASPAAAQGLGTLPGALPRNSDAYGVSADGLVIVGQSHGSDGLSHPYRWTLATGMTALTPHPGYSAAAVGVSDDGSWVVGNMNYSNGVTEAFRWHESIGYTPLGLLPGTNKSEAFAVSADGQIVVGDAQDGLGHGWALIWDPINQMRDLQLALEAELGSALGGWQLQDARDISADGSTIVGFGLNPCGLGEAWIARLTGPPIPEPPPCPGDVAHDGVVDFLDLNLLLSNYGAAARCGDLNGDGVVTFADLNELLSSFGTSCD